VLLVLLIVVQFCVVIADAVYHISVRVGTLLVAFFISVLFFCLSVSSKKVYGSVGQYEVQPSLQFHYYILIHSFSFLFYVDGSELRNWHKNLVDVAVA